MNNSNRLYALAAFAALSTGKRPHGLARTLDPERVKRAEKNATRANFNEKYSHPRRLRSCTSMKP